MPTERILIWIMVGLGSVFVFLDVTYYSGRNTPYAFLIISILIGGDFLLKKHSKKRPSSNAAKSFLEKILVGTIILLITAFAISLSVLSKIGPFGRHQ